MEGLIFYYNLRPLALEVLGHLQPETVELGEPFFLQEVVTGDGQECVKSRKLEPNSVVILYMWN